MLRPQTQRKVILAALLASPAIYLFMAAMVVSRGTGEFSLESARHAKYVGNEMFQELAFITANVPSKEVGYLWGESYIVQLVNPIPRFLWPGKPRLDSGIMMAKLKGEVDKRSGETYLTRSPGLIGEMYFNFGLPGIALLSFFGGWLVRGWDNMAERYSSSLPTMILYYMGLATLFIMGRSFSMEMLYGILFLMVGVWLVTKLMGIEPAPATATAGSRPQANPSTRRPIDPMRSPLRLPRRPTRGRPPMSPPSEGASE
jgi:oligosaccharide repeat unit polymerase